MRYEELMDAFESDIQHIRALMSARGVKETDEVDSDFIDVMREEGYTMPDLADFEEAFQEQPSEEELDRMFAWWEAQSLSAIKE